MKKMNIFCTLIIALFFQLISLGQESDTISSVTPLHIDSPFVVVSPIIDIDIEAFDPVILDIGGGFSFEVPTCSCLMKKEGKWYLRNSPSIPYNGKCVVMSNSSIEDSVFFSSGTMSPKIEDYELIKCQLVNRPRVVDLGRVLIISNYSNGFRHGKRSYFNGDGNLIKVEVYNLGELESTQYYLK